MTDEEAERAVEERRLWLLDQLSSAAKRLSVSPVGNDVVNTYDMRSAGVVARDHDREVWLRVVMEDPDYQPACRWDGNVEANQIKGVPKPEVLKWADWANTGDYRNGCRLRGEVMTLARGTAIEPDSVLLHDPKLSDKWWADLDSALRALWAHPAPEYDPVDLIGYTIRGVQAHFDVTLGPRVFDVIEWTTAHADLHWANITGPDLCILDWESWRRAPLGYDAATLYCNSILQAPAASKVRELFADVLDTPSGHISLLSASVRYLALVREGGEYDSLAAPLRLLGEGVIKAL